MVERMENLAGAGIKSENDVRYRLGKLSSCDAQGVVYEEASGRYMVKLYYPINCRTIAESVLERLRFIKNVDMPKRFVPVVDIIKKPYVGCVMESVNGYTSLNTYLIPDRKQTFAAWYNRGLGLYERIFVGYIISKAFAELGQSGISLCDISGSSILVSTKEGASVKLTDLDDVYIAGKGRAARLGSPRYMAPEVISGRCMPDVLSDSYSLAVVLYELLRVGHPYISDDILDGSPEEEELAYSGVYGYVTPENSRNMLPEKAVLTDKLQRLFQRCFVDGHSDRMLRPSATEFEHALLEASNELIKCSCGAWHYLRKNGEQYENCPWCDGPSRPTAWMDFHDILVKGNDYRASLAAGENKAEKLVNTYVLKRKPKSLVKNLYVFGSGDFARPSRATENYLTIALDDRGYSVYNEFSRSGIVVKRYKNGEYIQVGHQDKLRLYNGDEIYFEMQDTGATVVDCGGVQYSFIRKARFMEVK